MWRMQSGNRVLSAAEWECFCAGLGFVRDSVEDDLRYDSNDAESGVALFDRLSPEQKLALLADVASALSDSDIPIPCHTAANEGAIAAVLRTFWSDLCLELETERTASPEEPPCREHRQLLLAVAMEDPDADDLPPLSETDDDEWLALLAGFEARILWDEDFALADDLLDLPPEEMDACLKFLTIDRNYFVTVPREPNEAELITARQLLARMLGVPVIDDQGLYPFLDDLYHGLAIGPCPESEIAAWREVPWVQVAGCTTPHWECPYEIWRAELAPAIPVEAFAINPNATHPETRLPAEVTVEQRDDQWVVRDRRMGYWCSLLDNGWTDSPDIEEPALVFASAEEAASAYFQADRMYGERAERRRAALHRLGLPYID